jgi:hypothetical protein
MTPEWKKYCEEMALVQPMLGPVSMIFYLAYRYKPMYEIESWEDDGGK